MKTLPEGAEFFMQADEWMGRHNKARFYVIRTLHFLSRWSPSLPSEKLEVLKC
jgi:hypothetical protein